MSMSNEFIGNEFTFGGVRHHQRFAPTDGGGQNFGKGVVLGEFGLSNCVDFYFGGLIWTTPRRDLSALVSYYFAVFALGKGFC